MGERRNLFSDIILVEELTQRPQVRMEAEGEPEFMFNRVQD